jgi:peptidoglycan/xylan/chitin deacetylase (PgdA/CDA1 family)
VKGKKELLAQMGALTGMTRIAEALPRKASLIILNYHRIGDATSTPYDSGTFSATTTEFEWQVQFLKRHYRILTLPEALDVVHQRARLSDPAILLTFDDGYRDNYDEAFTVLRRHGVSATFFLPTAFVGTGLLPWWDVIAYLIKNASTETVALEYPVPAKFHLGSGNAGEVVMQVLRLFKHPAMTNPERFLSDVETACGTARPGNAAERCFLDWDEAREMQAAGMCFGSHTHTHPILGRLTGSAQVDEFVISREILERELGGKIESLAYPVGQRDSISEETSTALKLAGYSSGFSFYSGINSPGVIEPHNILRGAVEEESRALFRMRMVLKSVRAQDF